MLRILDRYVLREIGPSLVIGLGVFTFVILLNEILRLAELLFSGGARDAVEVILNLLPSVLCITIPMGFLLGILIALGRLAADSEITAMRASGISLYRLLRPVGVAAVLTWLISSYMIIEVMPDSNQRVRQALFRVMTSRAGTEVRPRVFYDKLVPNIIFFVQDIPSNSDIWKNVFLADLSIPESPRVTMAREGKLVINQEDETASFYLRNAEIHQVSYGDPDDYQRQISAEVLLPLPSQTFFPPNDLDIPRGARELTIDRLYNEYINTKQPVYLTEIHKKFSIPFACFVFGVLGLALGIKNRKDGRSSGFVISIAVIFVYWIFIDVGENMARNARLSPMLGMWSPNIVLGLTGLYLLVRNAREQGSGPDFSRLWHSLARRFSRRHTKQQLARGKDSRPTIVLQIPRLNIRFPNTLDRYVSVEFTRFFFLILSALTVVFLLGIVIEILPSVFTNRIQGKVVFEYVVMYLPEILFLMLPLATLMATLVNFAILTKTSEITAIKAGGISLYRLSVPVIIAGLLASCVCFGLQEYLRPNANRRVAELRDEILRRPPQTYNVLDRRWMMGQDKQIYHYAYFDPRRHKFSGLALYRFAPENFGMNERFYAEEAQWQPAKQSWKLTKGWRRHFDGEKKYERFDVLEVQDMESPAYFIKEEKDEDKMTFLELSDYIEELKRSGYDVIGLEVARWAKLSFPLAAVITVLISVPFSFTPGKKGALYGIGIAIAIGLTYYIATRCFVFMGEAAMLPPFMAALTPNILFGVAALYGLFNVRT